MYMMWGNLSALQNVTVRSSASANVCVWQPVHVKPERTLSARVRHSNPSPTNPTPDQAAPRRLPAQPRIVTKECAKSGRQAGANDHRRTTRNVTYVYSCICLLPTHDSLELPTRKHSDNPGTSDPGHTYTSRACMRVQGRHPGLCTRARQQAGKPCPPPNVFFS